MTAPVVLHDPRSDAQIKQMRRAFIAKQVPRTITAAATIALTDYLVACDATSVGFTVTLPTVISARGMSLLLAKVDSTAHVVTVAGSGSETINGANTQTVSAQWGGFQLYCDGTTWYTLVVSASVTAASVGAGTFPVGAFAFQGAVSGITALTASGPVTSLSGTTASTASGANVTIFSPSLGTDATWMISAANVGVSNNHGLCFVTCVNGALFTTNLFSVNSGPNVVISSGNVQLQQTSGSSQTMEWSAIRIR